MQIVEYQEERHSARHSYKGLANNLKKITAGLLRGQFHLRRNIREEVAQARRDLRQFRRIVCDRRAKLLRSRRLAKRYLQDVLKWKVGVTNLSLGAMPRQKSEAATGSILPRFQRQPGLADTWSTSEQDYRAEAIQ